MLALIVLTIVLAGAFIPTLRAQVNRTPVPPSQVSAFQYYDNTTGYNLVAYAFNQFGAPIPGYSFSVEVTAGGSSQSASGTTNSSGYLHLAVKVPAAPVEPGPQVFITEGSGNSLGLPMPPSDGESMAVFDSLAPVSDPSDPSRTDLLVFYAAANGSAPVGYGVYYSVGGGAVFGGIGAATANLTLLGTLDSFKGVFSFPSDSNFTSQDYINFEITDPQGNLVYTSGSSGSQFESESQAVREAASHVQGVASSFIEGLLGTFVPLMAILAAYSTYGKDRVSGVLESVLMRPISRRGLALSRYGSTTAALVLAVLLSLAGIDLITYSVLGVFLGWSILATAALALSVEAVVFAGLVFAVSRLLHSDGALVGLGVGFWLIFDFFWSVLQVVAAGLLGLQFGSARYYALLVFSNFLNPAQFYGLVQAYLTGTLSTGLFSAGGFQFNPAAYGIGPVTLALDGILWIAIPFTVFLYLATKRD